MKTRQNYFANATKPRDADREKITVFHFVPFLICYAAIFVLTFNFDFWLEQLGPTPLHILTVGICLVSGFAYKQLINRPALHLKWYQRPEFFAQLPLALAFGLSVVDGMILETEFLPMQFHIFAIFSGFLLIFTMRYQRIS